MNRSVDWPAPDTEVEDQLFAVCTMIFVNPMKSERALNALRHAASMRTLVHPGIEIEDDVKQLINKHKELAALLLQEPDPWLA